MQTPKAILMDEASMRRSLRRIAHEILEKNNGCENLAIIGIKSRGIPLAAEIAENIKEIEGIDVPTGSVDITFYRDDLTKLTPDPVLQNYNFPFDVTGKTIVLVDDVLYTGRTVRAAMDAVIAKGRPAAIQLAVLIDRGHRELPIRGDYVGKNIPTSTKEHVEVKIPPYDNRVQTELYDNLK